MFWQFSWRINLLKSSQFYFNESNYQIIQSIDIFSQLTWKYLKYLCPQTFFKWNAVWIQQNYHTNFEPIRATIYSHFIQTFPKFKTYVVNRTSNDSTEYPNNNRVSPWNCILHRFDHITSENIQIVFIWQDLR